MALHNLLESKDEDHKSALEIKKFEYLHPKIKSEDLIYDEKTKQYTLFDPIEFEKIQEWFEDNPGAAICPIGKKSVLKLSAQYTSEKVRYLMLYKQLGKGGCGSVYLAFDINSKEWVALKIHDLAKALDHDFVEAKMEDYTYDAETKKYTLFTNEEFALIKKWFQENPGCTIFPLSGLREEEDQGPYHLLKVKNKKFSVVLPVIP